MNYTNDQKINILSQSLVEKYKSIHIIRARVQNISISILGILLSISAWLFKSNTSFIDADKCILVIFTMLVWTFITLFYFNDLKKGFNSQRKVSIVIEDELGLFSNKLNLNSEDKKTIYPLSWKNFEEGNFFRNSYLLMGLGFVILMLTIIFIK